MAASKVLQFCLLVSFAIFSTHALRVRLTDGKTSGFEYETEINFHVEDGMKVYDGCVINNGTTYAARPATTKVIVYIKSYDRMKRTASRLRCIDKRAAITETLSEQNYELLYLAVTGFRFMDECVIGEFLRWTIKPNPELPQFQINTIGERRLNQIYKTTSGDLNKYQEESNVFGGDLLRKLRSMDE